MIRSEEEYHAALRELRRDRGMVREQERLLVGFGLTPDEVAQAPIRAIAEKLRKDIAAYERGRRARSP